MRDGDRWLFQVRRAHIADDLVAVVTSGKIGEYFQGFMELSQQFVRA